MIDGYFYQSKHEKFGLFPLDVNEILERVKSISKYLIFTIYYKNKIYYINYSLKIFTNCMFDCSAYLTNMINSIQRKTLQINKQQLNIIICMIL